MHQMTRALVIVLIVWLAGCGALFDGNSPDTATGARWYKGNLHTHSLWSDGDDFPERISAWYRDHGYDFLAISDHNTLQEGEKWVKFADLYRKGAGPATDEYLKTWAKLAQTRGDRKTGNQEIRLTPFEEYRSLIEHPGKFLLIQSEEISDKFGAKPIHMNATNLGQTIKPQGGDSVTQVIANNLREILAQAEKLHRPVLPHLNHPNFRWGVTAEDIAPVVEEHFFEIYNGHPMVNHNGDETRPGVEKIWDIVNTLRLTKFKAEPLMGLGTDDTHNYHVTGMSRSTPGRGWVFVRAKSLAIEALIEAMKAGDFYASSGVVLNDVHYDPATKTLTVEVKPEKNQKCTIAFVGSLTGADMDAAKIGVTLATTTGNRASYTITGKELYVRAVITSDQPPAVPSFENQQAQAWTQPVGWK